MCVRTCLLPFDWRWPRLVGSLREWASENTSPPLSHRHGTAALYSVGCCSLCVCVFHLKTTVQSSAQMIVMYLECLPCRAWREVWGTKRSCLSSVCREGQGEKTYIQSFKPHFQINANSRRSSCPYLCFDVVSADTLAVRPLLCVLWCGWLHVLHTDVPQPNWGFLSPSGWKELLLTAMASKNSFTSTEGILPPSSIHQIITCKFN